MTDLIPARMTPDGNAEWYVPYLAGPRQPLSPWARATMHTMAPSVPASEITQAGGRAAKPRKPVAVWTPSGEVTFIVGEGQTEAAEIEDLILEQREARPPDPDELRERQGLRPRSEVGPQIAERVVEAAQERKRNWRTQRSERERNYQRTVWAVPRKD